MSPNVRFYLSYGAKITVQSFKSHFMRENVRVLPYIRDVFKSVIS